MATDTDVQLITRHYGGMVLRLSNTADPYDTLDDTFELGGPLIVQFPDSNGDSALVVQDDNGLILAQFGSDGSITLRGAQFGGEAVVDDSLSCSFAVYDTNGVPVFLINGSGDIHQLGAALSQGDVMAIEENDEADYLPTPFWVTIGPYTRLKLTSSYSLPPLQISNISNDVIIKITEAGDLLYTGGLFFGGLG